MLKRIGIDTNDQSSVLFLILGLSIMLSFFTAAATELYFLAGIPLLLIGAYISIVDFRKIFYLLLMTIPLSMETALPGGFATDLPSEPLMVVLMGIYFFYVLLNGRKLSADFVKHPISLFLILHFLWILFTTITSQIFFVSFKFSLAKLWYITVFFYMAGSLLKTEKSHKIFFWCVNIPLVLTMLSILIRHAATGFSYDAVNGVMEPFYRNHVTYACILALFFPFVWFARSWYKPFSFTWWVLVGMIPFYLLAIHFSYSRTALVALVVAFGAWLVIHLKLTRLAIAISVAVTLLVVGYMANENTYMQFAPNYEKTTVHDSYENLVEATFEMKDISTMERVYRWIAGAYMFSERPWLGYGPGNFYNFYKSYTVTAFRTYVSDNPEKSGIHCYYLMTLAEQGFIGLFLFVLMNFYAIIRGETIYHQSKTSFRKMFVIACLMSMIVIDAMLIINDMVETDKVGSFFFIIMAILINADLQNQKEEESHVPKSLASH